MRNLLLTTFTIIIICQYVSSKPVLRWHPDFVVPGTYFSNLPLNDQPFYTSIGDIGWYLPAVAQLVDDTTGNIIKVNGYPILTSVSKKVWDAEQNNITLADNYTGVICVADHWARLSYWRWENWKPDLRQCGSTWVDMYRGEVWYRNIFFKEGFPGFGVGEERMVQIQLSYNGTLLKLNSLPFTTLSEDYLPNGLELVDPLPENVTANEQFTAKVRVINKKGYQINSTQYAHWEVMFGVSYVHKWFNRRISLWREQTDCELGGPDAVDHTVTNDRVIFKYLTNGEASLAIKLEDIYSNLQLNFTLKKRLPPYRRFPELEMHPDELSPEPYELFKAYVISSVSNTTHVKYQNYNPRDYFRGVLLTNITVIGQVAASIRIVPGHTFNGEQMINYPIENPIKVEIFDANGERVTSGPDSNLTVTALSDVLATCISTDSTFNLHRGIGTFPGSVCNGIATTSLKFRVTTTAGATLTTGKTANFKVVGRWRWIAAPGTRQEEELQRSALYYAWGQYWLGSRETQFVFSDTVPFFDTALKTTKTETCDNLVSVIGPSNDDDIELYSALASAQNYLLVSYTNTKDHFSDTFLYPNFIRVTFTDSYRYATIANALSARSWNKMVVVATLNDPIPDPFVVYMAYFNIKYEVAIFPPNATSATKTAFDGFFKQIADAKINTIFSFLKGESVKILVAEATKRNITGATGYLWMGEGNMIKDFPYENEGPCVGISKPTCVEAFRGATFFQTHYPMKGFHGGTMSYVKTAYSQLYKTTFEWQGGEEERIEAALAWDAVVVTVAALRHISSKKLTIYPSKLRQYIMEHPSTQAVTGHIIFDEAGNRRNYSASILQIDATAGMPLNKANVLKKKRLLFLGDNVTIANIQANNTIRELNVAGESLIYHTVDAVERNTIQYETIKGAVQDDLSLTHVPYTEKTVREKIPPAYYCPGGCGGALLDESDRTKWERGTCIKQGICQCNLDPNTGNPGYSGVNCQTIVCNGCLFGTCISPGNCTCDYGYINTVNKTDCGVPTCLKHGCSSNGKCTGADFCQCDASYYSPDCSKKCECGENGECSDGNSGGGQCKCSGGYIGDRCSTHIAAIVVPVLLGVTFLILLLVYLARWKYRQIQIQAQLMSTDWQADWESIRLRQNKQKSSLKSLMSMVSMVSTVSNEKEEKIASKNQANWNGKEVVLKLLDKDDVELTDTIRWEIKQMKDVKHPNLCLFIGACLTAPHVSILSEVCGKGSLDDILSNDEVELRWDFRYSMLKDICRGMMYLANSDIGSHGRLKTSNCLVDNRWTIKIGDYGLPNFRGVEKGERVFNLEERVGTSLPTADEMEGCDYFNLLWTAPEVIKTGVSHPNHVGKGNIVADVYSMAVIMVEMATRCHPFHELDASPAEIVQIVGRLIPTPTHVKLVECRDSENVGLQVLRPQLDASDLPKGDDTAQGYHNLVKDCWNHDPTCRPTFNKIMSRLNRISPHRGELMDNLIILMEQYTNSLEAIVAERTADLKVEKEKGDLLLTKMLPPLIAEELKSGNNPKPEFFSCVTIYFSDVVGFGKMCADCTPYEVVDLLNDLYSVMDDVIESFDCYKVETIADCYMVVSGLPVRNGDQHAGEIAKMSLQLLSSLNGVGYRHIPGSQVQLRIGIHSGPVVAGVVGTKMPRYCLFGDTVNTSSRMESGGYALKTHISEDTHKILDSLGGYQFESRGERQVKGRGTMTTYWLLGKEGEDYNLPSEDMALSRSQHDFK